MSVLTEQQIAFLRALAAGATPAEAYRVGFGHAEMRPWMRGAAHKLMNRQKLGRFVEAARGDYAREVEAATAKEAAEQASAHAALLAELGISRERIIRELARIAFADPTQFMSWDAEGNVRLRDSAEIGEAASVLIAEVGSGRVKMKQQDKLAALAALARMLGLFDRAKESAEERSPLNLSITIGGEDTAPRAESGA